MVKEEAGGGAIDGQGDRRYAPDGEAYTQSQFEALNAEDLTFDMLDIVGPPPVMDRVKRSAKRRPTPVKSAVSKPK